MDARVLFLFVIVKDDGTRLVGRTALKGKDRNRAAFG